MYAASSGVALGITPGSLKLVRKSADMTNTNRSAPITGIAGVIRTARNGQLNNTKFFFIKIVAFLLFCGLQKHLGAFKLLNH